MSDDEILRVDTSKNIKILEEFKSEHTDFVLIGGKELEMTSVNFKWETHLNCNKKKYANVRLETIPRHFDMFKKIYEGLYFALNKNFVEIETHIAKSNSKYIISAISIIGINKNKITCLKIDRCLVNRYGINPGDGPFSHFIVVYNVKKFSVCDPAKLANFKIEQFHHCS